MFREKKKPVLVFDIPVWFVNKPNRMNQLLLRFYFPMEQEPNIKTKPGANCEISAITFEFRFVFYFANYMSLDMFPTKVKGVHISYIEIGKILESGPSNMYSDFDSNSLLMQKRRTYVFGYTY